VASRPLGRRRRGIPVHCTTSRFHGPYLAGTPYKPVVLRHGMPGVIPENWLNFRIDDYPLAIRSATGVSAAEGPQTAGSAGVSKSWRRGLVDVGPAGFLLADDFGNAGIDFSGEGEEIFGFHVPHLHSVAASQEFDALVG
jgi:hypothetical protein